MKNLGRFVSIFSGSMLVVSCASSPQVQYQIAPMRGATQTMTPQQALIVCKQEARVAGEATENSNKDLKAMGGFLPTLIAGQQRSKSQDNAFIACLAKVGFELEQIDRSEKKSTQYDRNQEKPTQYEINRDILPLNHKLYQTEFDITKTSTWLVCKYGRREEGQMKRVFNLDKVKKCPEYYLDSE